MEKENKILRQKVANLENENFSLKTDVYKIKIDLDDNSREVSDITLKIDNIQTSF